MTREISTQGTSAGRLGPPPALFRNNSHTSQHSIHSQRSHSSQTHHVTPSDPTTLANLIHGFPDEEEIQHHRHSHHGACVHPQHRNLFVAQDGMTGVPSFEELAVTEERDWLEGMEEEEERAEDDGTEPSNVIKAGKDANRRRSVTFQQAGASGSATSTAVYNSDDGSPSRGDGKSALHELDATERDPLLPTKRDTASQGQRDGSVYDPTKDPHEWARIREGSIARRSRWRRPGPYWLLPIVICVAFSLGMGMAPKQELMINLACLAHPPRTATVSAHEDFFAEDYGVVHLVRDIWRGPPREESFEDVWARDREMLSMSKGRPTSTAADMTISVPLSPADKWMLDVQRRMAADRKRWNAGKGNQTRDGLPHGPVGGLPVGGGIEDGPGKVDPTAGKNGPDDIPRGREPSPHSRPDIGREGSRDEEPRPGEIDPRLCKKDPRVQAAAAKLMMSMTLCMGILSALSTGFWGAVSDRLGRTSVLAVSLLGFAMSDTILVVTARYPHRVPFGYRFIILGPIIDGLLGGFSTISATNNAYLSDTTPDGSRAKVFSRFGGILMIGFSIGPLIGSALIRATGDILSVFYVAATLNSTFVLFALFILPESLSSEARSALGKLAKDKALRRAQREDAEREWENNGDGEDADANASGWSRLSGVTTTSTRSRRRIAGRLRRVRRRVFAFLAPLSMFLPRERADGTAKKQGEKDWNLTFLILSSFCMSTLMAILQLKSQFLIYTYGWSSTELGPYMTLMGFCRAMVLVVLLPLVVKLFKPQVQKDSSTAEPTPDVPPTGPGLLRSAQTLADSKFDLWILRASLLADAIAYTGMSFSLPAPIFIFFTCVVSLGSCSSAVTNSLALNLIDSSRQAGKLFGALSVVSATASSFVGPLVFSMIYANTVGVYAPTIFAVAVGVVVVAQLLLMGVRLPHVHPSVAGDESGRGERGRTRRTKRVKSSSSFRRAQGVEGTASASD
ncbi:hypothetical protein NliqN6_1417 [Naganishia liquefaciens]|uniref:MFS transporter n=1 Tax=Naganishia liquefaciens TaxID=104408 RepID=A0A8H3YD46_9TREE|nr:hypothetical protein NliqN6_1417 [Naganishia liquefaciens]